LTTGEQVLKRLGFEKSLKESLSRQGMVALSTYLATYFFLARQKPSFEPVIDPDADPAPLERKGGATVQEAKEEKEEADKGEADNDEEEVEKAPNLKKSAPTGLKPPTIARISVR